MRKSDIEKLAKAKAPRKTKPAGGGAVAPDAPERPQEREEQKAVNLSRETIGALADGLAAAIVKRLEVLLPVCARLAAADTLRTVQKPETVMSAAIKEGLVAAQIIERAKA